MEVNIIPGNGLATNKFVFQVQVGGICRQAPSTSPHTLGFPEIDNKTRSLAVALYQHVGRADIVHKASHGESRSYKAKFGDTGCECELEVRPMRPADGHAPQNLQDGTTGSVGNIADEAANSYLEKHEILELIQSVIELLLKDCPDDPFKFMASHILNGFDDDTRAEASRTKGDMASSTKPAPPLPLPTGMTHPEGVTPQTTGDMASSTEPAPPPPRPAGMTHPESVTAEMKQRQWHEPEKWSMSLDQLFGVLDCCKQEDLKKKDMYYVNDAFVKPWSKGTGCGISILMNPCPKNPALELPAQLMLSHAWGEDVDEFMEALRKWQWENHVAGSLRVWFCLFANYQCEDHAGPDIQRQINMKPFARVIESEAVKLDKGGRGMLAVHTTTCDLYQRLWCVHEVERAISQKVLLQAALSDNYMKGITSRVEYILSVGGSCQSALDAAGVTVNTARAECSRPQDREILIKQIVESEGQFAHLNSVICNFRTRTLPVEVLWKLAEGGMKLNSVEEHGDDLAVALLICGLAAERFAEVEGALKDDLALEALACNLLWRSEQVATQIVALGKNDWRPWRVNFAAMDAVGCMDADRVSRVYQHDRGEARKAMARFEAEQAIERLDDDRLRVRQDAADALGTMGKLAGKEAVAPLIRRCRDEEDCSAFRAASEALGKMGELAGSKVVKALIVRLGDGNGNVRLVAAEALGTIGERAGKEAVGALIQRCRDEKEVDAFRAASKALGKMGGFAGPVALEALIGRLGDDRVRRFAAEALATMHEDAGLLAVGAIIRRCRVERGGDEIRAASEALGKICEVAGPGIAAALIGHIDDRDRIVRLVAADALGTMGERAGKEAVAPLMRRCRDDPKSDVRQRAAEALGKMGENAGTKAVEALIGRLDDNDKGVRLVAAEALGTIGKRAGEAAVGALIQRCRDERGVDAFLAASEALRKMGEIAGKKAVEACIGRLDDNDKGVRRVAAKALGKLGEIAGSKVVKALVVRLVDEDKEVRQFAAEALGTLGKRAGEEAVGALIQRCRDERDVDAFRAASEALGKMGEIAGPEAVGALIGRLRVDMLVLKAAPEALGKICEFAGPGIAAAIIGNLDDDLWYVRLVAAKALGKMGERAGKEAVAPLIRRCRVDPKSDVRQRAAEALGKMGEIAGTEAVKALIVLLDDDDKGVRRFTAEALGTIGERAGEAAGGALIRRCCDEKEVDAFRAASEALGKMGESAGPEAVAALIGRLDDDRLKVRLVAAKALGTMGELGGTTAARALAETLFKRRLEDPCFSACRESLRGLGDEVVNAAPAFLQMLKDNEPQRRSLAAELLGEYGKHWPPEVAAALAEGLADSDRDVREASTKALRLVLAQARFQAKALIPSLFNGLKSESADVKFRCLRALAQAIELATTKSKQLEEELAKRLGPKISPQEVRQLLDRVCEGNVRAAKELSRPPVAKQAAQSD